MVVDTTYYDALEVTPTATDLEIKRAYRRLAIQLHPDKNPDDPSAHEKFQAIGEAYQVLSDKGLRGAYDKYGKEKAQPSSGFEDPSEFFNMIFGGDAFEDWIGELSLLKDMTKQMEISMRNQEDEEGEVDPEAAAAAEAAQATGEDPSASKAGHPDAKDTKVPPSATVVDGGIEEAAQKLNINDPSHTSSSTPSKPASGTSTPRPGGVPNRLMLEAPPEGWENIDPADAAQMTEEEKRLREKAKKKGGLTKEQREELLAFEMERKAKRQERVDTLSRKLVDRLSLWTETDKGRDVTEAFRQKMKLEMENLMMESFGLEILHSMGAVYLARGSIFLKSQKFFGITGFWSRLKEKGNAARETWTAISTAIDAQVTMEEMARLEEKGGEDWTQERKAEWEKKVTGKILAAAWRGSKYEIQSILKEVCEKVLYDKNVKLEKRIERAQALAIIGELFAAAQRDPSEEQDAFAFEILMAEASVKQEKKKEKKGKEEETMETR